MSSYSPPSHDQPLVIASTQYATLACHHIASLALCVYVCACVCDLWIVTVQ